MVLMKLKKLTGHYFNLSYSSFFANDDDSQSHLILGYFEDLFQKMKNDQIRNICQIVISSKMLDWCNTFDKIYLKNSVTSLKD